MRDNTLTEVGRLTRVLVKHPRDAFVSEDAIAAQWRPLGFTAPPALVHAIEEYEAFLEILRATGARLEGARRYLYENGKGGGPAGTTSNCETSAALP